MATESSALITNNSTFDILPVNTVLSLCHVQQSYNWDCGLACIQMILNNEGRQKFQRDLPTILNEERINRSLWSIDMAYLLKRLGVDHHYYTIETGVNDTYANLRYYKDVVDCDRQRVLTKFEQAQIKGIQISKRSVTITEILNHLAKSTPVIVLINSFLIDCTAHVSHRVQNTIYQMCSYCCSKNLFIGHYIVLTGYDLNTNSIIYENPAYGCGKCKMTFDDLELARKSYGTDEDIIFLYLS